jgi:phospholipid/cholesterol/gamma-HCH transport system permease protein
MYNIITTIGRSTIEIFCIIGRFCIFLSRALTDGLTINCNIKELLSQIKYMFVNTLPLIAITAIFTGTVLALQSYTGFSRMHAESSIASIVVISIARELGPVLSGLMFAGRLGSSIAAEIATMRVTEQIDALDILGINSKAYLVFPRVIAGMISLPLLVIFADILGVFGGYMVATHNLGFDNNAYIHQTMKFIQFHDVLSGVIKAFWFGIAICSIGCYSGFWTSGGAQGVGRTTTKSVVCSAISVFTLNYIITTVMFAF